MRSFLLLQGSRPGLFYAISTPRFAEPGLRIPFDRPLGHEPFGHELRVERLEAEWLRAAVSPIDTP